MYEQDFCELYFSLETIIKWLVTQSTIPYFVCSSSLFMQQILRSLQRIRIELRRFPTRTSLSQVKHFKADLFTKTGERIISWFHLIENRLKLRFAGRSQEQKLPMEQSPLLKTNWISLKQVYTFKNSLVDFPFEYAQIDAQN